MTTHYLSPKLLFFTVAFMAMSWMAFSQIVIPPFPPGETWIISNGYNAKSHPEWTSCACFFKESGCGNQSNVLDGSPTDHFRNQLYALDLSPTAGSPSYNVTRNVYSPVNGTAVAPRLDEETGDYVIVIDIDNSPYTLVLAHVATPSIEAGVVRQGQIVGTDAGHIHMHLDHRTAQTQNCSSDPSNTVPHEPQPFTGDYAIHGAQVYNLAIGSSHRNTTISSKPLVPLSAKITPDVAKLCERDLQEKGLVLTALAQGGVGTIKYKWQVYTATGWANTGSYEAIYKATTAGQYRCVVTAGDDVLKPEVLVKTYAPVLATATPDNHVACSAGEQITFGAVATGGDKSYLYQWQVRALDANGNIIWNNIGGANGSTFTTAVIGRYRCVVTSCREQAITNMVRLKEPNPLTATASGGEVVVCAGATVQFSAAPTGGNGVYSYQWQIRKPDPQGDMIWTNIYGANAPTYQTNQLGAHRCVITSCGLQIATNNVSVKHAPPVSIGSNPVPEMTVCPGAFYTFAVSAQGGNGQYQFLWQEYSSAYGTWINTDVRTHWISTSKVGSYRCVVTSCDQSVASASGTLKNYPALRIAVEPKSTTACPGRNAFLSVVPGGGDGNYSYQWERYLSSAWTAISGATASTYSTGSSGTYRCRINSCGQTKYSLIVNVTYSGSCTALTIDDDAVRDAGETLQTNSTTQTSLVYPNPVEQEVMVDLGATDAEADEYIQTVKLANSQGHVVKQWPAGAKARAMKLDMSIVTDGIYYLHILTSKKTLQRKLIKSRQ